MKITLENLVSNYEPFYTSTAQFSNSFDERGKWEVNLSSELDYLIKEAAKNCVAYASDLFISWASFEKKLYDPNLTNHVEYFGFRKYGVDHESFIRCRINSNDFTEYESIYVIEVLPDPDYKDFLTFRFGKIWEKEN